MKKKNYISPEIVVNVLAMEAELLAETRVRPVDDASEDIWVTDGTENPDPSDGFRPAREFWSDDDDSNSSLW